jgi:hypothetical protein
MLGKASGRASEGTNGVASLATVVDIIPEFMIISPSNHHQFIVTMIL